MIGLQRVERETSRHNSELRGKDVFGVLPTGYGKTLCFSCLPIAFDNLLGTATGQSLVIIVSPLKALMEDQVRTYCFVFSSIIPVAIQCI